MPETDRRIKILLKEGCGILSISRILEISSKTVLSRILRLKKVIKPSQFLTMGCKFQIDEMYVRISNGKSQNWLTHALESKSKRIIGYVIGNRSKENIAPLVDKVLQLNPKSIYTDKLTVYPSLIPVKLHKRFKYCTNKIERNNLTLRTHVKRLARKTICFSKKEKYLDAHLAIYFWG